VPTENYLKSVLRKAKEQVKALEGGLRHIGSEMTKLEKKHNQFEQMLKLRKQDILKLEKQLQDIQKTQIKEGGIDRWQSISPR
jgi:hypothetical protein